MTVTIIGIGLIGGSMAMALRKNGFGDRFVGVDSSAMHRSDAIWLGLVDEILPLDDAVRKSDVVILAIPVDTAGQTLLHVLDIIENDRTVVADMGSTKSEICSACRKHRRRGQYVASHPIAGTEFSGPKAAIENLFQGKKMIVCDPEASSDHALKTLTAMYETIGMDVSYMSSEIHDRHIAFVSHISHISSFALGTTVLNIEKDEKSIFTMAGSGFSSTVRLAKSSPQTWNPIFLQNADSILLALDAYIEQLEKFRQSLKSKNSSQLEKLMTEANEIKKIIK